MEKQLNINNIFSSPIASLNLDFDTETIQNYCYETKFENIGVQISNIDGWQSDDLVFPNPLNNIAQTACNVGQTYFENLNGKKEYQTFLDNMWININPKGGYNMPHIHPKTFVSGVVYVKTPQNCGKIWFMHPSDAIEYDWLSKPYWKEYIENTSRLYYMNVQPKMLYIFPSWLKHGVEPNTSDEDRISISFNIGLEEKNISMES